jgi:hypothetical protein
MSIWLRILNWSFQLALRSYAGFHFRLFEMGILIQLGCLDLGLYWDTKGLSKAVVEQESAHQ